METVQESAKDLRIPRASIHRVEADGLKIFYREAGPSDAPVVLLLHGFPTSSFQYRELIPRLADRYRVVAPDLPGFGFTEVPDERHYKYSFDGLAKTILAFTDALGLTRYALYVFDYGAPTGFRLAMSRPDRVTAIISQNGNAYEEGLGNAWAPIRRYWSEPSSENRAAIRTALNLEGLRGIFLRHFKPGLNCARRLYARCRADGAAWQHGHPVCDMFLDYANNVKLYPAFQEYFRKAQPPLLAIWGRHDPYFVPAGARPSGATTRTPWFNCSIPDISHSKRTSKRLPWQRNNSWRRLFAEKQTKMLKLSTTWTMTTLAVGLIVLLVRPLGTQSEVGFSAGRPSDVASTMQTARGAIIGDWGICAPVLEAATSTT